MNRGAPFEPTTAPDGTCPSYKFVYCATATLFMLCTIMISREVIPKCNLFTPSETSSSLWALLQETMLLRM
jgi:hypothetical protein